MTELAANAGAKKEQEFLLRAEKITKVYSDGTVALKEASVEIHRSEIVGLLGENGAGKTTLTKILSGLLPPTRGRVVSPKGILRFSNPREALAFGIGMVHQHFALVGTFTAAENVALSHERPFSRIQLSKATQRLEELMKESGLHVPLEIPVEKLAVGEQQRVEILKVLSRDVTLLILDEPTSVLTPLEVDVRRLRDAGKSIILITHKLKEVKSVTDRIVVLRHGELVGDVRTQKTTTEELARLMVGRTIEEETAAVELSDKEMPVKSQHKAVDRSQTSVLHVENLVSRSKAGKIAVEDLAFDVFAGEIFGQS